MILTKEKLEKMNIGEEWFQTLSVLLEKYNMNKEDDIFSKNELAMFLAQCSHESAYFTVLEENLHYKPERLLEVFPARVKTIANAKNICEGGAKRIGNFVYGGRLGNGVDNDDGYNFRGRGIIQLTGKANYAEFSKLIGLDIVSKPYLLKEKYNALLIALIFWQTRKCSVPAQNADVKAVTKIINGKYNGLTERENIFEKYRKIIFE